MAQLSPRAPTTEPRGSGDWAPQLERSPRTSAKDPTCCNQDLMQPLLAAQTVKNPPAMQETRDPSLGREDPLEKEMAIHPNTLAWRTPWTEEPGGL